LKTLIITGGSSGIGKATAMLFSQHDYHVYELSRHGESHDGIVHIDCDVTSAENCREAITNVIEKEAHIDLLISNAGMGISGPIEFTAEEDARRILDVNFFGAMNISQAVLPIMRRQRSGRIIFVSSVAAIFSIPYQSFYSASKSALNAYALAMHNEVKDFGIDVCCLLPGDVKTGFTAAREKNLTGADIYPNMRKSIETMEKDEQNGMKPEKIASQLWRIANSRLAMVYNVSGWPYKLFCFLERLLPKTFVNWIVGKIY
jgi:short-subunit dehydrogenase